MRRERTKPIKKRSALPPIGALLLPWYARARRPLPWRKDPTPYAVWVSEIMLQQTRVETVIPYYLRFLERFPSLEELAAADLEEVLALWSGLGYYRRARSLHAGAKTVVEKHRSELPRDLEGALEIPGIGDYTAGAILSIAYNLPVPVVDGNVERVLTRLLRIRGNPQEAVTARKLRRIALESIPEGRASDFNQSLMELGATVCTPRNPACDRCPLEDACLARKARDVMRYPETAPARKTVPVTLHTAVVEQGDLYLLERVTRDGFLKGLWLFPFVEAAAGGMQPSGKLTSALRKKLGAGVVCAGHLGSVRHAITFRRITIDVFRFEIPGRRSLDRTARTAQARDNLRWVRLEELGRSLPVSSIALKIARQLGIDGAPILPAPAP